MDAQLYHFHDPELLPLAARLKRNLDVPIVYDKHESYSGRSGMRAKAAEKLEERYLGECDRIVIAESSYIEDLGDFEERVVPILNYYKSDLKEQRTTPIKVDKDETLRIVYTGFSSRGRGLEAILSLAKEIQKQEKDYRISLVGACQIEEDRNWFEEELNQSGLENVVVLKGWNEYLDHTTIEDELRSSHLGIALLQPQPNYLVSIPTKFYEFMHFGIPFICSDFPLWKSFLEQNDVGRSIAFDASGQDLLDLVSQMTQSEEYLSLSGNALKKSEYYSWQKMSSVLVGMYKELLS